MASRGLILQPRDVRVLEEVLARRSATVERLHAAHFPSVSRKVATNRLGRLVAAGYLTRRRGRQHGRADGVYVLGPKARAALLLRSQFAFELIHYGRPGDRRG